MKLAEYNTILDEVESMKNFAHACLEEAEQKRVEALKQARLFIRECIRKELGPDSKPTDIGQVELLSVSTALVLIENGRKLVPTIQAVLTLNAMVEEAEE